MHMLMSVFNNGHTEGDTAFPNYNTRDLRQQCRKAGKALLMQPGAAGMLPDADGQHFAQAAFNGTVKVRMDLDPVNRDDVIRLRCVFINIYRDIACGPPDDHRIHRRPDGNPHRLLGNAVARDKRFLFFSNTAGVAAHGRHNKRLCPMTKECIQGGLHDLVQIRNAPAAHKYRYGVPWPDMSLRPQCFNLRFGFSRYIIQMLIRKQLGNRNKMGQSNFLCAFR